MSLLQFGIKKERILNVLKRLKIDYDYCMTHLLIHCIFRRGQLFVPDFYIISSARALIVKITVSYCLAFDTNVFVPASLSVLADFFLCRLVFSLRY